MKSSSMDTSALKPYLIPIAAVMAVLVAVPLVIMPGYTDITETLSDISDQKALKEQLQTKSAQLDALDHQANIELLQDLAEPAVPSEPAPAGLLGHLENMAQAAGLQVRTSTYSHAAAPSSGTTLASDSISASIAVVGSYPDLSRFIANTEHSLRLTSINSLTITNEQSASAGTLLATVQVVSPYVPALTDLGPEETPLPSIDISANSPLRQRLESYDLGRFTRLNPSEITGKSNPF